MIIFVIFKVVCSIEQNRTKLFSVLKTQDNHISILGAEKYMDFWKVSPNIFGKLLTISLENKVPKDFAIGHL